MAIPVLLALALAAQAPPAVATATVAPRLLEPPKLIQKVEPVYPPAAWTEGREAAVALAIDIDTEGHVTAVEVLESGGADFDAAAVDAARQFVFSPAIGDHRPSSSTPQQPSAASQGQGPMAVRIRYRTRFVITVVTTTVAAPPPLASTTTSAPTIADLPPVPQSAVNFLGTVREGGTRAPVAYAGVVVQSETGEVLTSTETNEAGKFALRGVPEGKHTIRVSAAYFATLEVQESLSARESVEVLYFMERTDRSPYEVFVRGKIPRKEVSRRTIQFEEIRRIPGAQGDAIRVLQNLPGVARAPFGLGLLVVRGAPPQSTGVFFDGHRIPLLFHFGGVGGVTSVVNSRALDQINFYPGGFSPKYGRLSAGAVELVSREPATDRVHGEAQIDFLTIVPINVSVFLEGPVTSDPNDGTFFFSLRRSSIDGIFALATELLDASIALAPRYYDYQARWVKPLADRATLSFSFYGSDDELVLVGAPDLGGANAGGPTGTRSRTFFHRFNPRLTLRPDDDTKIEISPIVGADFTDTQTTGGGPNSDFSLRIENFNAGLRIDGETKMSDKIELYAGGELLYYGFTADFTVPSFQSVKDFPSPINVDLPLRKDRARIPVLLATAYAEMRIEPIEGLTLYPGLRLDGYDFQAEEQLLVDPRLVEGRSVFGLDPRLTARYEFNDDFAVKGQVGLYRQPPLPPQLYVNATLPLEVAQQYSFGIEWDLIEKLNLDIQGFYRFSDQVPRGTNDVEVSDGILRPVGLRGDGQQRSYGLEVLLKLEKRWGFNGWIAYTLSRSEFRRADDDEWRPNFIFDQTHNLNIIAVYELALNWALGARFRFVTGGGLPDTTARWYDADADQYRRNTDGETRAPPFHQLDLYIEKKWSFDEWYLEIYLDVQNIYNASNTEAFIPTFDFKRTERLPGIPIFPSLGIRGTF